MTRYVFSAVLVFGLFGPALAAPPTAQGLLIVERVPGPSLRDNLTGESTSRVVAIYLPPSYASEPSRRFPVLYLLHGIGGTHADWTRPGLSARPWQTMQDVMNRGIASGRIAELIVVAPSQLTRGGGSFYTNSIVTGRWEDFTVYDLVRHVDTSYRTLARPESRGIAGHSMGGYGAIKLGMKHPDVFGVVYGMNAAVLGFAEDLSEDNAAFARAMTARPEELNPRADFWVPTILCIAQALSPNPDNPPFLVDLPYERRAGRLVPTDAFERWKKEMPLYMVEDYRENLQKLVALRFDSGRYDRFTHIPATNLALSEKLTELGIPHVFEDYNGNHGQSLWGPEGRIATEVLPFFSRLLVAEPATASP